MVPDNMIKYPDYMEDFEYIAALARWQRVLMKVLNDNIRGFLYEVTLDCKGDINSYWHTFVPDLKNVDTVETVKAMHKKHTVTTFDVLKEYVAGIIKESYFTMEYDDSIKTVKIRVKQYQYDTDAEKLIRKIIPCNLLLDFQEVAELG